LAGSSGEVWGVPAAMDKIRWAEPIVARHCNMVTRVQVFRSSFSFSLTTSVFVRKLYIQILRFITQVLGDPSHTAPVYCANNTNNRSGTWSFNYNDLHRLQTRLTESGYPSLVYRTEPRQFLSLAILRTDHSLPIVCSITS
jgi:hypothetical protein